MLWGKGVLSGCPLQWCLRAKEVAANRAMHERTESVYIAGVSKACQLHAHSIHSCTAHEGPADWVHTFCLPFFPMHDVRARILTQAVQAPTECVIQLLAALCCVCYILWSSACKLPFQRLHLCMHAGTTWVCKGL